MVIAVSWLALLAGAVGGFVLSYQFLGLLKDKHPDIWTSLGSPTLFLHNTPKNNKAVLRFLRRREYLRVGDEELTRRSIRLWRFSKLYLLVFAVIVCMFVLNIFSPGWIP
jgi:hypothetical protein